MPVILSSRLRRHGLSLSRVHSLAENILRAAGVARAEISLLLVGDRSMRRLNRLYRRKDRTTDVLAFPSAVFPRLASHPSTGSGSRARSRDASRLTSSSLGDIVISIPQAERQAARAGHAFERELAVLVIHGTLHLLGYDHERSAREATRMSRREALVLRKVGRLPRFAGRDR